MLWAAAAVVCILLLTVGSDFQLFVSGFVLIYAIAAIGLQWLMGRAGQVSIGNAALIAIGAYTTAIVSDTSWGVFPVPVIVSAVVGGVVGLIIGLPALRLRGLYLALATLGLHFITVFAADRYQRNTGELFGLQVASPSLGPLDLADRRTFVAILMVLLAGLVLLLTNVYRFMPGRLWSSIRESELGAGAVGVPTVRWKLAAFVGSSAVIAVAGSLYAYYSRVVSVETFTLHFAISFLVMIIIGGVGSIVGALTGAILVTTAPYVLDSVANRLPAGGGFGDWLDSNIFHITNGLYGVILVFFLLYQPEGLVPALGRAGRWLSDRRRHVGAAEAKAEARPTPTEARETEAMPSRDDIVLELAGLGVRYGGGARAVDDIDLVVPRDSIVALLGRNGAGKTSVLRAITGFFRSEEAAVEGRVLLDGKDIAGATPTATSRRGVVLVPERDKVFPSLSVADHLRLAAPHGHVKEEIFDIFPRLTQRMKTPAGLLSGGERQMLAVAMAWVRNPKLLLLDEVSLGLAPILTRELLDRIVEINERDRIPVLLVEQNAKAALSIAHYAYVLESGRVVASGTPSELEFDPALTGAYLGTAP
ncbi:MAG: hypothetical protein CL424_09040 [Acidimicrobiaceae bacterium]|nr:hypothetical protein [Acidimicrobiaceae bacterium]